MHRTDELKLLGNDCILAVLSYHIGISVMESAACCHTDCVGVTK